MLRDIAQIYYAIKKQPKALRNRVFDHQKKSDKLMIVSTGPSAGEFWNNINFRMQFADYDICILNDAFSFHKEQVLELKPQFWCLTDGAYFGDMPDGNEKDALKRKNIIDENLKILEKVDWPLFMIVPMRKMINVDNANIHHIYLNTIVNSVLKQRFWFYDRNMMNPCGNSVGHSSIYFGIMSGYKTIGIIGNEYNFFKEIELMEDGRVTMSLSHSYKSNAVMDEWILNDDSIYCNAREGVVSSFLRRVSDSMAGFSYLREYADYRGARVINYSKGTMIDAFDIAE